VDAFGTCRDHSGEHCTGLFAWGSLEIRVSRPGIPEPRFEARDSRFGFECSVPAQVNAQGARSLAEKECQRSEVGAWEFSVQLVCLAFSFPFNWVLMNVLASTERKSTNEQKYLQNGRTPMGLFTKQIS